MIYKSINKAKHDLFIYLTSYFYQTPLSMEERKLYFIFLFYFPILNSGKSGWMSEIAKGMHLYR